MKVAIILAALLSGGVQEAAFAAEKLAVHRVPSLEREHFNKAPLSQVRKEALEGLASSLVEVERPTWTGLMGPSSNPSALRFASRPRSAGNPGLCEATTVWIKLKPRADDDPVGTSTVYKAVGDLRPLPDMWNDAYGRSLALKCSTAGRVIPTEDGDFNQLGFFTVTPESANDAWLAARALDVAIKAAVKGSLKPNCRLARGLPENEQVTAETAKDRSGPRDCDKPQAALGGLALDRLLGASVKPCGADTLVICVTGTFLRSADFNERHVWDVSVKARQAEERGDITELLGAELQAGVIIID